MDNDYNNLVGAWPESYVFTDKQGKALWRSTFDGKAIKELEEADMIFDQMVLDAEGINMAE
jgi:hypothetical protein